MDRIDKLMWLRQDINQNIQLADNKAHALMTNYGDVPGIPQLYLEAIQPNLDTPEAPAGYEIFNATEEAHIEYQCNVCRQILLKKYAIVNKMVRLATAYMEVEDGIAQAERDFEEVAADIVFEDEEKGVD